MNRFTVEDNYPKETIVCYSIWKTGLYTLVLSFILGVSYFFIGLSSVGFIILILGGYFWFKQLFEFIQAIRKIPQIRLTKEGIQTISTPFYRWIEIQDEKVIQTGSLNSSNTTAYYFTFKHPLGTEKLRIGSFDTSKEQLRKLLVYYRIQSKL
jgi:hypothetical protein